MSLKTLVTSKPSRKALLSAFNSYWGCRKAISQASGDEQQQLIEWALLALESVENPRAKTMKLALERMKTQETPIQETFSLDATGNLTQVKKAKKAKKSKSGKGKKAKAAKIQAKATSASSERDELASEIVAMVLAALAAKGL